MGAKKKGGKGKKGKKKGGLADDVDPAEKNFILQAEIESLQMKLVRQTELSNSQKGAERDLAARDKVLKAAQDEQK